MRRRIWGGQLVLAGLLTGVLNGPALLVDRTGPGLLLLAGMLFLLCLLAGWLRRRATRSRSTTTFRTGLQPVEGIRIENADVDALMRSFRRRTRVLRLWPILVAIALVLGSVLGRLAVGPWGQLIGGAAGFLLATAALLVLTPLRSLSP